MDIDNYIETLDSQNYQSTIDGGLSSSQDYRNTVKRFQAWVRQNSTASTDNGVNETTNTAELDEAGFAIDSNASRNIARYMRHLQLQGIQKKAAKNGYGFFRLDVTKSKRLECDGVGSKWRFRKPYI